jgi:hypothetical protein
LGFVQASIPASRGLILSGYSSSISTLIHRPEVWRSLFAWLIFRNRLTLADYGQNFGAYPRTLIVSAVLVTWIAVFVLINKL